MRKVCIWSVVLVMVFSSFCWGSQDLTNRWIVKFKTIESIPTTKVGNPTEVINYLKQQLSNNLEVGKSTLNLQNSEKFWAANAIAVTATPEEVKQIKQLANVESVKPVQYRKWIFDSKDSATLRADTTDVQWSISKVRAPEVWNKLKIDGSGIVVGHIDTGIDAKHPLLAGKVILFKDFLATQTEPYDDEGHGTHTAGTICGLNGVGVAPGAKLIVAKVFDSGGSGNDENILKAMQWMMDPDGDPKTNDFPKIVSNSWGGGPEETAFFEITKNWEALGILPVFAAGNDGPSGKVGTPGCYKQCWAVAATTKSDALAYFSSVGPSTVNGETYVKPDIAAPGQGVISCKANSGGALCSESGTSMACPHVAGLAALMLQANPNLTTAQIRDIAESTAIDLGDKGKDNKFGSGRYDAFVCLSKVTAATPAENNFSGYKAVLEAEKAFLSGNSAISPLAAPSVYYLIEKARSLDEGEFSSLRNEFSGDPSVTQVLKQAASARMFEKLQH
ncbi:MAG: S8 family serine peptidase [Candidatus Riflebacteria bacterium]|nr:S8 family serine peptidase [Candidatus Riflebacteria bacterium]